MRDALRHFRSGRHYGYPLCCTFWFALAHALGVKRQAVRRGVIDRPVPGDRSSLYVPCLWCRTSHPMARPIDTNTYLVDPDGTVIRIVRHRP